MEQNKPNDADAFTNGFMRIYPHREKPAPEHGGSFKNTDKVRDNDKQMIGDTIGNKFKRKDKHMPKFRSMEEYGVVITTPNGVMAYCVEADKYPTRTAIKQFLEYAQARELMMLADRETGWRTAENIRKDADEIKSMHKLMVKAVDRGEYKVITQASVRKG